MDRILNRDFAPPSCVIDALESSRVLREYSEAQAPLIVSMLSCGDTQMARSWATLSSQGCGTLPTARRPDELPTLDELLMPVLRALELPPGKPPIRPRLEAPIVLPAAVPESV